MKIIKDLNELTNDLTIVDFFANWCGPCKMLSPNLEELEENGIVKVLKVDCDQSLDLARQFNVNTIPQMFMFKNKELVSKQTGYMDYDELVEWVNAYK